MKIMKQLRKESNLDRVLVNAQEELMNLRAQLASGGSITNPKKITALKKKIARIHTIKRENELSSANKG